MLIIDTIYLDHAGTTLYSRTLIDRFSADMLGNLYGNPHSASSASVLSANKIENIRHLALQYLGLDCTHYDLVFVANATAAVKLVVEAFQREGFWYGYHKDSHTSLVGVREAASSGHRCFTSDEEVDNWLDDARDDNFVLQHPILFSYPAQSNMNGRRLPLRWALDLHKRAKTIGAYMLLDAAGLVSTAPINLADQVHGPDFIALSFYKIFGFPDLGALAVRKSSADVLATRPYFGGGTVDMVLCLNEQWHARKSTTAHDMLEDGTLPIHSIMALGHAIASHTQQFGSLARISRHVSQLSKHLYNSMADLVHANGRPLCSTLR